MSVTHTVITLVGISIATLVITLTTCWAVVAVFTWLFSKWE
jgi:hypothetical protein